MEGATDIDCGVGEAYQMASLLVFMVLFLSQFQENILSHNQARLHHVFEMWIDSPTLIGRIHRIHAAVSRRDHKAVQECLNMYTKIMRGRDWSPESIYSKLYPCFRLRSSTYNQYLYANTMRFYQKHASSAFSSRDIVPAQNITAARYMESLIGQWIAARDYCETHDPTAVHAYEAMAEDAQAHLQSYHQGLLRDLRPGDIPVSVIDLPLTGTLNTALGPVFAVSFGKHKEVFFVDFEDMPHAVFYGPVASYVDTPFLQALANYMDKSITRAEGVPAAFVYPPSSRSSQQGLIIPGNLPELLYPPTGPKKGCSVM